ncbi:MAG: hypothetical protein HZB91_11235 [Elusimicrobia bacterium]|nr:hypothetical protein [Elusimicrobiota bacterium]
MGIRGTIVAGVVNDDGSTTAVLLGPGANNNAGERPGAFNLSNDAGSSDVTQPGFGSNLGAGDAPPTPPALVPSEQLGAIMGALEAPAEQSGSGEGGGSGGSTASTGSSGESSGESSDGSGGTAAGEGGDTASGGDSTGGDTAAGGEAVDGGADMLSSGMDAGDGGTTDVADLAGQDTMGAAGDIADFDSIAGVTDVSNSVTNTASTDSGDSAVVEANSVFIADGASTWDDARTVTGGTGYYGGAGVFTLTQCQGGSCAHPAGFFAYLMKIDFGNQTYSAGSYVWAEDDGTQTAVTDYAMVRETSYAALSGEAVGQAVSDSGELLVNFTLKNIDGVAAAGVDAAASFSNAGGDLGSGTGSFPLVGSMADSAWESVQAVPSGVGVFAGAGYFQLTQCVGSVACVNPDGVFAYLLRIDFGAQTYGGGESGAALMAEDIDTGTSISASMSIPETDFSLLSGSPLIQADGGSFDVDFTLKDVDGNTAAALEAVASYNDGETMGNGTSWGIRAPSDGLTSLWSGLNGVTSGAGYFKGEGVLTLSDCDGGGCVSPTGSFSYLVYIDFASQQFGGNGSVASMAASDPGTGVYVTESMEIGQEPYALYLGPANLVSYGNWHYVSENWAFGMDFSLKDVQGVPGGGLSAYAYYSDDYGNSGEGWTFAPRQAVSDWAGVSAIGSGTAWFAGSGALRPDACYGDYCADLCYGGSCTGPAGGFRYALLVDFAGTYGGSGSGASIWFEDEQYWTSVNDRVDIPAGQPFPENGAAHITSGLSDSGNFSVNFTLTDLSGSSAMGLEASVSYYDGNNWNIGYGHASAGRSSPLADGASTWQDALALEGGMARFGGAGPFVLTQCGGGACLSPEGFFAYVALIDFGARTYQGSAYLKAGSITDDLRVDRTSFDGSSGAASFAGTSDSDSFSVDFSLNNAGGLAAVGLDAVATYDDSLTNPGSPTLGSGSASGPMMGLDSSIWDGVIAIPDGVGVFTGRGLRSYHVQQLCLRRPQGLLRVPGQGRFCQRHLRRHGLGGHDPGQRPGQFDLGLGDHRNRQQRLRGLCRQRRREYVRHLLLRRRERLD